MSQSEPLIPLYVILPAADADPPPGGIAVGPAGVIKDTMRQQGPYEKNGTSEGAREWLFLLVSRTVLRLIS